MPLSCQVAPLSQRELHKDGGGGGGGVAGSGPVREQEGRNFPVIGLPQRWPISDVYLTGLIVRISV